MKPSRSEKTSKVVSYSGFVILNLDHRIFNPSKLVFYFTAFGQAEGFELATKTFEEISQSFLFRNDTSKVLAFFQLSDFSFLTYSTFFLSPLNVPFGWIKLTAMISPSFSSNFTLNPSSTFRLNSCSPILTSSYSGCPGTEA